MSSVSFNRCQIVLLAACAATVGCGKAEDIRSYAVPKEVAPPRVAASEKDSGEPTDRMLTAIVPEAERAWFYKLVGPIAAVGNQEKAMLDFVASIPPSGSASLPAWKLPEAWSQQAGDGIRLATIRIPAEGKPLEITVTALPWRGTPDELLQNVNRWRGQMKLSPTNSEGLAKDTRELNAGERTITVVDLRGRSGGGGMMPPFAGGGPFAPNTKGGDPMRGGLPPGHPTVDGDAAVGGRGRGAEPANVAAAADDPKFALPEGWQPLAPSQFRRLGFQIADGPRTATVTVSDFGAQSAPMISDPLQNVNRWRGEVLMDRITADDLDKTTERIEIDGHPATYVSLIPDVPEPTASGSRATLGAMVTVGDRIWYFKMSGTRALVDAEQEKFKTFLKSVKFTE